MLRRNFLIGISALALFDSPRARAVVKDPLPPEGVEFLYRVTYGGNEIGTQRVRIREHDETGHVVVEHETKIEVRIFFAVAYSLHHRSTEVWNGFTLKSVRSETVENDDVYEVVGDALEQGFRIRNAQNVWIASRGAVSSDSFWIAAAMESAEVINTRTGESATPIIERLGDGRLHFRAKFDHGLIQATMQFDGDFLAEAEINSNGHKVKLERMRA